MILQCPACSTRYVVPDSAIGPDGRQVRCANCRESWFADGAPIVSAAAPEVSSLASAPPPPEPAQREFSDLARDPAPPTPAPESERVAPESRPVFHGDVADPFAHERLFKPRRNPAKMWTAIAIGAFILLAAGIGAIAYFGAPSLGFGARSAESALDVQLVRRPERRILASGHELLSITGRIVNMSDEEQSVPDIRAELRNAQGAVVYDWTIQAPQRTLPPREMVEFNSAEIDIPRNADELNLQFAETSSIPAEPAPQEE